MRLYFIDWIRALAFLLLIFFHCCMPFVQFNWEIKNATSSDFLDRLIIFLHQWRLPILFFIAGIGANFSLTKRSLSRFYGERFVRLFIPLLFAMFFTIPLQVYYEWLQKGIIKMSYLTFYPKVWELIPYPEGALTWSHMWFVVYLFVFTILLLPIFALFKFNFIQQLKLKADGLFKSPLALILPIFLFASIYFYFYNDWPEQGSLLDDWFVFNFSISLFLLGYLLGDLPSFFTTAERYRSNFLITALMAAALQYIFFWEHLEWRKLTSSTDIYQYGFINSVMIWCLIVAILGYAKKYLSFNHPVLVYLNEAVFPFYIIHQTIIVAIGYYITKLDWPIILKLVVLIILTSLAMFTIYQYLIRKFKLTRFLLGMKIKNYQ